MNHHVLTRKYIKTGFRSQPNQWDRRWNLLAERPNDQNRCCDRTNHETNMSLHWRKSHERGEYERLLAHEIKWNKDTRANLRRYLVYISVLPSFCSVFGCDNSTSFTEVAGPRQPLDQRWRWPLFHFPSAESVIWKKICGQSADSVGTPLRV